MGHDIPARSSARTVVYECCARAIQAVKSTRALLQFLSPVSSHSTLHPPEKMFRRAKKNKKFKGGAVWICDGDDHNYGIDASVIVDGSGHATTSYTRYIRYDDDLLPQTNFSDAKCEEGTEETEADLPKARKQVCQYNF